jgi:hypothetical protein
MKAADHRVMISSTASDTRLKQRIGTLYGAAPPW